MKADGKPSIREGLGTKSILAATAGAAVGIAAVGAWLMRRSERAKHAAYESYRKTYAPAEGPGNDFTEAAARDERETNDPD